MDDYISTMQYRSKLVLQHQKEARLRFETSPRVRKMLKKRLREMDRKPCLGTDSSDAFINHLETDSLNGMFCTAKEEYLKEAERLKRGCVFDSVRAKLHQKCGLNCPLLKKEEAAATVAEG